MPPLMWAGLEQARLLVQTGLARPLRRVGVNSLAQVATLILVAVGSELLVKRFLWAGAIPTWVAPGRPGGTATPRGEER